MVRALDGIELPVTKANYWSYSRNSADIHARWRRREASQRPRIQPKTQEWIREKLEMGWSPQQIAGRSLIDGPQRVSHEYIYRLVIRDKKAGGGLYRRLRRFGKRKQRLGKRTYSGPGITDRVSINQRPKAVKRRSRLGDLEGDLIVGKHQKGHILSVVDRKSRLLALEPLKTRKAPEVKAAFLAAIKRMPKAHTLTLDNAKEFSCHKDLTKRLGIKVYFADPYCSYQRGSIENANGLVRKYFPKKTDFSTINHAEIRKVERLINSRPRKVLGYLTAFEASTRN